MEAIKNNKLTEFFCILNHSPISLDPDKILYDDKLKCNIEINSKIEQLLWESSSVKHYLPHSLISFESNLSSINLKKGRIWDNVVSRRSLNDPQCVHWSSEISTMLWMQISKYILNIENQNKLKMLFITTCIFVIDP